MVQLGQQLIGRVAFGLFEADLQTGELWKAGRKVRLQSQPFKVLAVLLEHAGEVVTRGELQGRLWGKDAVGDFDQSLGTAVNKIREALGDTADNPRFVETLARRGYRFIAPVSVTANAAGAPAEVAVGGAGNGPAGSRTVESGAARGGVASDGVAGVATTKDAGAGRAARERLAASPMPGAGDGVSGPDTLPRVGESGSGTFAAAVQAVQAGVAPSLPGQISSSPPLSLPVRGEGLRAEAVEPAKAVSGGFRWRRALVVAAAGICALSGILGLGEFWRHRDDRAIPALLRIDQLTHIGRVAPGMPGMESLPASASDGLRIFIPVLEGGRSVLSRVDVHTGAVQPIDLPHEVASPMLGDLSPDLSTLLLRSHLSPESEQPLWRAPVGGGSALQLPNVVAHDATWMPDGKSILYAVGNRLMVNHPEDGESTVFATLPGRALWMRWSPDGGLLRFTLLDPLRHTMGLWQIDSAGKHLDMLLKGWDQPSSECCGIWTDDGKYFVFQATRGDHTDLWRLTRDATAAPVQLTDGPLDFAAPVSPDHGSRIYFLGLDTQSVMQRYDAAKGRFVPVESFLADASRVEYSRDRTRVVWVDLAGRAWRAQADGSERVQLTPDTLQVFLAKWSPDGEQIALMARESGSAWQIYLTSAEGGTLRHLDTGTRNAADPSWSADGRLLVFGRVNDVMGDEGAPRSLETIDVRTGARVPVPGSSGLFSPRWSPDGRYIAALSLDQHQVLLFNVAAGRWQTLARTTAADPVWSADSRALYFHAALAELQPIYRVSIPDGHLQQVANLFSFAVTPTDYFFAGLGLDGAPLVRSRTSTGDLYTLDLEQRSHPERPR